MLNICIPTLNRADLLEDTIKSILNSSLVADRIYIIDNGRQEFSQFIRDNVYNIVVPGRNIGVAASWNWFINNVSEFRLICNDDVIFYEDTLEILINNYDSENITYPSGIPSANAFSCYIISDTVVNKVGLFDEAISPGYAYFEDNDYFRRMSLLGIRLVGVPNARLDHKTSSSLKKGIPNHNQLFNKAQKNYITKWGGLPHKEKYLTPYNK